MQENTTWIVEYSASSQDFQIQELNKTLDDNLFTSLQGIIKDYQLIGVFYTKETAQIFMEGFKTRRASIAALQARVPIESGKATQLSLNYAKAVALLKREVASRPRGFIKKMCEDANLTYHTVIGLLNDSLPFDAVEMVSDVLVALGYQVTMTKVMVSLSNRTKKYKEEITYLITKETPNTNPISS